VPGPVTFILILLVLGVIFMATSARVAREYERGVVFRLGHLHAIKGPGLYILIPGVDKAVTVDLRTIALDVPPQEVITRDNVSVAVTAVAYFRVVDSRKAIIQVDNYLGATLQVAQTTLRSVLGEVTLDELLSQREAINTRLQGIIDQQTEPWGIKVSNVEVKDVELPEGMQRALARQAEAERERRAKVIAAKGELEASHELAQAAETIARQPIALQLRYLQTMAEIASEGKSNTIIPFPIDILAVLMENKRGVGGGTEN
jgi:regulator of protease activity HflC (stomatin/prohibitin superfamily)